jgi:hypothetical protein
MGAPEHGFTHEHAIPGAVPGVAYHALSDQRSYAAVRAVTGSADPLTELTAPAAGTDASVLSDSRRLLLGTTRESAARAVMDASNRR